MACRCKKSYFLFSESLVHLKETGDMFGRYARMRFGANGRKAGPREVVIDDIF